MHRTAHLAIGHPRVTLLGFDGNAMGHAKSSLYASFWPPSMTMECVAPDASASAFVGAAVWIQHEERVAPYHGSSRVLICRAARTVPRKLRKADDACFDPIALRLACS